MPNRNLTRDFVRHIAKRKSNDALEEFSEILESGDMDWKEIDLPTILEHDFGVSGETG